MNDMGADLLAEMVAWRRQVHAHPETAFEERATSALVAQVLEGAGIEVVRGIAKTGVVGTLKVGEGSRTIGLRADMDALHMDEKNTFAHRSIHAGKMHACGHDGHTAMLLGAAVHLARTRAFDGTVRFIFQPAEENEGGGRVMVEEGLFERFPVDAVYGMHNMPGLAAGHFAVRAGPMLASYDVFEIAITGRGSHAAMPHHGVDPIVVAAQMVVALQSVVSRNANPLDAVVLSVTQIHGGSTLNVIPDDVVVRGTTRAFQEAHQTWLEASIRRIADGVAAAMGASVEMRYERRYPPTVNTPAETRIAAATAARVAGEGGVDDDVQPVMGAEDFAFMLRERPGCQIFIGNGAGSVGGCMLHNPYYDFNDAILNNGMRYWVALVEGQLAPAQDAGQADPRAPYTG